MNFIILGKCSGNLCDIQNLEPFTTYNCTFKASCPDNMYGSVSLTKKTLSSGKYKTGFSHF